MVILTVEIWLTCLSNNRNLESIGLIYSNNLIFSQAISSLFEPLTIFWSSSCCYTSLRAIVANGHFKQSPRSLLRWFCWRIYHLICLFWGRLRPFWTPAALTLMFCFIDSYYYISNIILHIFWISSSSTCSYNQKILYFLSFEVVRWDPH